VEKFIINSVFNNVAIGCNKILDTVIDGYQFHVFQKFKILVLFVCFLFVCLFWRDNPPVG